MWIKHYTYCNNELEYFPNFFADMASGKSSLSELRKSAMRLISDLNCSENQAPIQAPFFIVFIQSWTPRPRLPLSLTRLSFVMSSHGTVLREILALIHQNTFCSKTNAWGRNSFNGSFCYFFRAHLIMGHFSPKALDQKNDDLKVCTFHYFSNLCEITPFAFCRSSVSTKLTICDMVWLV